MRILIADDSKISQEILSANLKKWGHEVVLVENGQDALEILSSNDAPKLAVLDWMMPRLDGLTVCERIRGMGKDSIYIILLTARDKEDDIIAGLTAGADDYITKPFNQGELRARLNVGIRVVRLQENLNRRIHELEKTLSEVKELKGLLPICSYCKRIRNDQNYWQQVESFLGEHTDASFSHSICPDCYEKHVKSNMKT